MLDQVCGPVTGVNLEHMTPLMLPWTQDPWARCVRLCRWSHAHERRVGGGDVSDGDRALASGGVAGRDHSGGQRPADRFPASIRVGGR